VFRVGDPVVVWVLHYTREKIAAVLITGRAMDGY